MRRIEEQLVLAACCERILLPSCVRGAQSLATEAAATGLRDQRGFKMGFHNARGDSAKAKGRGANAHK